jgi:zinc transporter 2
VNDHGHDHGHGGSCTGHDHSSHGNKVDNHVAHGGGDVNLEAAYMHVLTDLIQSIGVAIAGLVMWFIPHWEIIDPACTLIFSIVAMRSTIPLLGKIFIILFEGTPAHVSVHMVRELRSTIHVLIYFQTGGLGTCT